MNGFFVFILIVVTVLCIILFFKVWGMTTSVKNLEKRFCNYAQNYNNSESEIDKQELFLMYLAGDKDMLYKTLNQCYISHFLDIVRTVRALPDDITLYSSYQKKRVPKEEYIQEKLEPLKTKLSRYYKLIGKEMPATLAKITVDDYNNFMK